MGWDGVGGHGEREGGWIKNDLTGSSSSLLFLFFFLLT